MGAAIFFAFVAVPIAEIAIFIEVGGRIGFWPTIAVVILTALAGTALLRHQGLATLHNAQVSLEAGHFPVDAVFDGLCLLLAGALLLTPGFFTDSVGFLMFVPPVRRLLRRALIGVLARRGHITLDGRAFGPDGRESVIDGEFEDVTPDPPRDTPPEPGGGDDPPKRLPGDGRRGPPSGRSGD